MDREGSFPKRLVGYVNSTGVRALDRLAEQMTASPEGEAVPKYTAALQSLVDQWKALSPEDKEQFMARVTTAIVEAVVASAALPAGLKIGKKAVKAGNKIIKKQKKRLRKAAKANVQSDTKPAKKKKVKR